MHARDVVRYSKDTLLAVCSRPGRMSLPEIPPFKPHPLLRGGNSQTIAGVYLPGKRHAYRAERHFIDLADGDQVVLHDDRPATWRDGDRIALLVHGLGGCHGSPYMVRIAGKLRARGVRVFRKDLRGWGAGTTIAKQPFHAARTDDIAAALATIHQQSPDSPIALVGFSLGANMLLKMLGDVGAGQDPQASTRGDADTGWQPVSTGQPVPAQVDRALAIAPPIDLMRCCIDLNRGFGRVYDRNYAKFLWNHLRARVSVVPEFAAALHQRRPRRIYEFDKRFTAPMGGFDSVEHYYHSASSIGALRHIQVPTLILGAANDPIVPGHVFDDVELSPHVRLHLTECGGHLGFIAAGNGEPDRRWMDWRVVDFVTS